MFHLLIVDDEASVVDSLADTLPWADIGITGVFKAYSGAEALGMMRLNSIDIVISDIQMPGMSGIELLERIRKSWRKTKCIVLSGYAEFSYAQQAIRHNSYDYLLKPIGDGEIMDKVEAIVKLLQEERQEDRSYQRAIKAFRENLPKIRGELLNGLLQGKRYSDSRLNEELEMVSVDVRQNDCFALMLMRLEQGFAEMDFLSLSLMEYAIGNIAEELFEDKFRLWACRDVHGYLLFMVTLNDERPAGDDASPAPRSPSPEDAELFQLAASRLQSSVKQYLKGSVSVIVSGWGFFPHDMNGLYQSLLASLRRMLGDQDDLFIAAPAEREPMSIPSLQTLYEPPMLVHLLESGDWKAIGEKLGLIFGELGAKGAESTEHLVEVFFFIYSAFSSFAHKNGRRMEEMLGIGLADLRELSACRSVDALRGWASQALDFMQRDMERETRSTRETVVRKIQEFVRKHLGEDVSLLAIADHMYMHPVHVSRIYKLVAGENLSDYVLRLKMERAVELLTGSTLKNYEIALRLGYQNPNYFIKVFKKYYSVTPQEYRLKLPE
ncbi:response regulator [Cohnella herbarum]|uniref:Response regulator n=1 Tax=Cohnella herbarum TaxID=2728023 RepID=A0A7Z2ZKD4_9BACL|nr:response regulator [Cohnella herbarum]QJD81982.1 response regulator [Cohnella herbarum]